SLLGHQAGAQSRLKQNSLEAGFLFGITLYSGDLTDDPVEVKETHPGYGAFVRYGFNRNLALKGHVYAGTISGDDRNSATLQNRNLRFSSSVVELGLTAEWAPFNPPHYNSTGVHKVRFMPYLYGGIGRTFASVQAEYYGPPELRDRILRVPLPEPDLPTQFWMTPVGLGLRADLFERVVLGAEMGWRPVFSDAIDGIKQNGNPLKGDWYYFAGVMVSFVLTDPQRFR
ncbi:MAG TPA: DUF6089 family protein, partial [Saprospiraceae bacterium]|nr:DUF6089 family protein [Saprospiraceae bacterium]